MLTEMEMTKTLITTVATIAEVQTQDLNNTIYAFYTGPLGRFSEVGLTSSRSCEPTKSLEKMFYSIAAFFFVNYFKMWGVR
jgi:hypothetical protein